MSRLFRAGSFGIAIALLSPLGHSAELTQNTVDAQAPIGWSAESTTVYLAQRVSVALTAVPMLSLPESGRVDVQLRNGFLCSTSYCFQAGRQMQQLSLPITSLADWQFGHIAANTRGGRMQTDLTINGFHLQLTSNAAADHMPDTLQFKPVTSTLSGTWVQSNAISVKGLSEAVLATIEGGELQVDGNGWTSAPTTIANGQRLRVRHVAGSTWGRSSISKVTIGAYQTSFKSTLMADTTPNAFVFTAVTGAIRSTVYTSNAITVAGIDTATEISIVGGEYSINAGSFSSATGTVNNGDMVRVRVTSSASYSMNTTTTLTIGGVAGAYVVTTAADGSGGGGGYGGGGGGSFPLLALVLLSLLRITRLALNK